MWESTNSCFLNFSLSLHRIFGLLFDFHTSQSHVGQIHTKIKFCQLVRLVRFSYILSTQYPHSANSFSEDPHTNYFARAICCYLVHYENMNPYASC
jgi:hypothetical protein